MSMRKLHPINELNSGQSIAQQILEYQMGWEGRSPAGCDTLPMFDVLKAQRKGDRLWKRL